MRTIVKKRLQFLVVALVVFGSGFQWMPDTVNLNGSVKDVFPLLLGIFGYFILLPALYWRWIIKAGQQKSWKILITLSLSCVCARYSFPTNIAEYFDFITYVRYPIIAVVLLIELFLLWTIIKGLWGARSLSGDPRIHTFEKYKNDDKKLTAALPMSWEPASWYYAIPKFSRQHAPAITHLEVNSRQTIHWAALMVGFIGLSVLSYLLLVDWSEIVAVIIASLSFYSVFFVTANYRIAKHYSIYFHENKLMINNAFWSFVVVELDDVAEVNIGNFSKQDNKEQVMLGKGKIANIELVFSTPQTFIGTLGQLNEQIDSIWVNVQSPDNLCKALSEGVETKKVA